MSDTFLLLLTGDPLLLSSESRGAIPCSDSLSIELFAPNLTPSPTYCQIGRIFGVSIFHPLSGTCDDIEKITA